MFATLIPIMQLLLFALGIYAAFSATNWIFGANNSVKEGQKFSWTKFFSGVGRAALIFIAVALTTVGAALLPELNVRITEVFGTAIINAELINGVSAVGILTAIIAGIGIQAKNAFGKIFDWFSIDREQRELDEIIDEIEKDEKEQEEIEKAIAEAETEQYEEIEMLDFSDEGINTEAIALQD